MLHARSDYNRIQDPENKIGEDEPVFLLRATDISAPDTLRFWAEENKRNGGDPKLTALARVHANTMAMWQVVNGFKPADL